MWRGFCYYFVQTVINTAYIFSFQENRTNWLLEVISTKKITLQQDYYNILKKLEQKFKKLG